MIGEMSSGPRRGSTRRSGARTGSTMARSSLEMVNGDTVEIAASGDTLEINGESMVICGNVTTANATVHIIDTVLMPPA